MLRQFRSRKRKCPGLTVFSIFLGSLQVVVKVAAAEHIIPGFVFFCHIIAQHLNLPLADGIAVAVGGHVQIENHQFFPVIHRDPGDAVAAVQIEDVLKEVEMGKLLRRAELTGYLENRPSPDLLLPWGWVNG